MTETATLLTPPTDNARLLDLLPVGACVIGEDLRICHWNTKLEEWTEVSKQVAIGAELSQFFPNVCERRYYERLQQVFTTGMPATYSAAFHKHFLPVPARHGLDELACMVQETEVRIFSTSPKLALVTIQDVSFQFWQLQQLKNERADLVAVQHQLEAANQQLQNKNAELDEFCYIASHDLQEPLRKIMTFSQLFEKKFGDKLTGDGLKYLEFMSSASRRMKLLITDLLSLSKTGRAEVKMKPVEINKCISHALDFLSVRIEETGANIIRDRMPSVLGDKRLISQVYQNLIGNALKFTVANRRPCIHLTATQEGDFWKLGVKDNGIGVEPEYADQIFKPFKRLHGVDSHQGSGIGLSICKKAIGRMGGSIHAESTPGQGCQLFFTVPIIDTGEDSISSAPASSTQRSTSDG